MQHTTRLSLLISQFLISFVLTALTTSLAQAQDTGGAFQQLSPPAQSIATAINQVRVNAGLSPLLVHSLLNQAAQNHVNDIVVNHIYGHYGSDGSNVRQRVRRTGYSSIGGASENWVATGTPEQAMQWWMNDWIHRVNILTPQWREMGIGIAYDASNGMTLYVTDFTPGSDGSVAIDSSTVAQQAAEGVNASASVTANPAPVEIPAEGLEYTIQAGDTLYTIALRYGIDWTEIALVNRLGEHSILQIDQRLHLPGVGQVGGLVDTASVAATDPATGNNSFIRRYTVQSGDTLVIIAKLYNLNWQDVAAANGLGERAILQVGQELRIPGEIQKPTASSAGSAPLEEQSSGLHVVQPGDTILSIALRYNVDWKVLLRLNGFTESTVLQVGQQVWLK